MILLNLIAAMGATAIGHPAACSRFNERPSPRSRTDEAVAISHSTGHYTTASLIGAVLRDGGWRLVWATPRDSEPGVFFLKLRDSTLQLVDIWGGSTSDRQEAADWARTKVGVPEPLARCFGERLVREGP